MTRYPHYTLTAVDQKDPYRIALLDAQMPGMDGETLGRLVKEDPVLKKTSLLPFMGMP